MKTQHLHLAALCLGIAALTGCHKAPQQLLKDVKAPAGYNFATTRPVDVQLTALASALPASGSARVTVARADGRVIFHGRVNARQMTRLHIAVPLHDSALLATLLGPNGTTTDVKVPISGGVAAWSFQ